MKNLSNILLASVAILFFSSIAAQNPFWTFPDQSFDEGEIALYSLPTGSSSPDYTGFTSDYVHAGLKTPHGEIMFFVVDGQVFDRNGNFINELQYNGHRISGNSEILIINKPGSCTEWYIFLSGVAGLNIEDKELPYVAVFDNEDQSDNFWGSLQTDAGSNTALPLMGTVLPAATASEGFDNINSRGIHFAASKKRHDGSRSVYVSTNYKMYRMNVTCEGLANSGWTHIIGGQVRSGFRTELEIHENDSTGHTRIALPYLFVDNEAIVWLRLLETDTFGVTIPSRVKSLNIGHGPGGSHPRIHGVEFSPDGNTVYITHDPSASHTTGLSRYNYMTNVLQPATGLSGISGFKNSQIQSRKINATDYRLWLTNGSSLGTIDDLGGGTFFWNPNVIGMGMNYPVNYALFPGQVPHDDNKLYVVPDQVDYENYDAMFTETCDCCERYIRYDFWDEFDNRNDVFSGTWTDVINPVHTGNTGYGLDTLFVRDTLYIRAGESLTWLNLHVFFAPKAVVVLQRGFGSLAGGELILDNTELTVDQRCFYRKITCSNPLDSCDRKHWEGIRVEGWENEAQALTGFTKQGRLKMYNGSTIAHARIGILAGHKTKSGFGGGVIDVNQSAFLDNETSIKYDPYVRTNTLGTELWSIGNVRRSRFATTPSFFTEGYNPKEFIHVRENGGLRLAANVYENMIPDSFTVATRGKGIYMANSRVRETWACAGIQLDCSDGTILRSEFRDLHIGADGINSDTLVTRTFYLNHAKLINNRIGVSLTFFQSPEILDNHFEVERAGNAAGIYLNGSTGYFVENNYFTSFQTGLKAPWNFGIAINYSRRAYNEIYRNRFERITIGGVSQGVNANPSDAFNTGLKWLCNTFEHPILYADLLINTGTISDEQGSCTVGFPVPAGNYFSHSSATLQNHLDLRAHYPGTDPMLDVNYRHHQVTSGTSLRLRPLAWTGIAGPPIAFNITECTGIFYNPANTCPTKKTSLPVPIELGPKSNDVVIVTHQGLWNQAETIETELQNAAAAMDGGNTELLLEMIYSGASSDEIAYMLLQSGVNPSQLVMDALETSGMASSMESLQTIEMGQYGTDTEWLNSTQAWLEARIMKGRFWRETLSVLVSDTTGVMTPAEILNFLNAFQPEEGAFLAQSIALKSGSSVPDWIKPQADFTVQHTAPSGTVNLPTEVPWLFEEGFFSLAGDHSFLNAAYIAQGKSYMPHIIPFDTTDVDLLAGVDKSFSTYTEHDREGGFLVFPNPFNAQVQFLKSKNLEFRDQIIIEFFDLLGRRVHSARFTEGSLFTIPGTHLPKGMLAYTIWIDGSPVQQGKVVRGE